jgi:hypothetical protein
MPLQSPERKTTENSSERKESGKPEVRTNDMPAWKPENIE